MTTVVEPASGAGTTTVAGVLAHCEYLVAKGYAPASQINNWKGALRTVFEIVDGDDWEAVDVASTDLDEYMRRFQTLALSGQKYKAESIRAYRQRARRAIDAYLFFLENGKPINFDPPAKRPKATDATPAAPVVKLEPKPEPDQPAMNSSQDGMIDFPFPLKNGRMATLRLPSRLTSDDVNRLSGFLRTLQDDTTEQRQLPERAGENSQAA
jgi:hypothetical protein